MQKTVFSSKYGLMFGVIAVLVFTIHVANADFIFGEPTKVPNVNGPNSDGSPQISRDGLELYYNYNTIGGVCSTDIWVARRSNPKEPWSMPFMLDAPVNSPGPQHTPSLSADGLELYFSDGYRSGTTGAGCTPNPGGYGHSDLWVAKRGNKYDPWGIPENLGSIVNSENPEDMPCISADGLELYFVYDSDPAETQSDSPTNTDIYVTTRATKDAPWGQPVKLSSHVNSEQYEFFPFISPDGLALFFSRGYSHCHIYVCRRATTSHPWGPAQFFTPVNSGRSSFYTEPGDGETEVCLSYSANDSTLYFTRGSNALSTTSDFDIWQVEVTPTVDLNSDGAVNKLDVYELLEHWGRGRGSQGWSNSLYDIAPMPFGDGVVDAKDLMVLAEHILANEQNTDANDL